MKPSHKSGSFQRPDWFPASRRESFLLHLRPATYQKDSISIKNTGYLGFLCMFFFVLETVTGLFLMIYYVPSTESAYGSILRLMYEVPFGALMRDVHRLGGELMIFVVSLHLLRVFCTDSYRNSQTLTWFTGVGLLVATLMLGFSGYLLPWDQLAYWAVTIGTSMADIIPGIGPKLTAILRGGPEFGQDGLLRFYLLHIIGIPVIMLLLTAIHYYRVVRVHGLSLPVKKEQELAIQHGNRGKAEKKSFFPDIFLQEMWIINLLLLLLIFVCTYYYNAPLENHADPKHTPVDTAAPWFFLWLQGMLKLGDTFVYGVLVPVFLFILLLCLPLLRKGKRKWLRQRPFTIAVVVLFTLFLGVSSYFGSPKFGITLHPVSRILYTSIPDEQESVFHKIGYGSLEPGVMYVTSDTVNGTIGVSDFGEKLKKLLNEIKEEQEYDAIEGVVLVEEWQRGLKRIILRVLWQENNIDTVHSQERKVFVADRGERRIEEEVR